MTWPVLSVVAERLGRKLVGDRLGESVELLLPAPRVRGAGWGHPVRRGPGGVGGGRGRAEGRRRRAAAAAGLGGGAGPGAPPVGGPWTEAGVWWWHRAVRDRRGAQGLVDWSPAVVGTAAVRAKGGG